MRDGHYHRSAVAARYRIRVAGQLDPRWAAWFDGLHVHPHADGTTVLEGAVVDQAALYGLISRLRDLGLTLLALERLADDEPDVPERPG